MEKDVCIYDAYVKILNAELVPAMGCTDPIVIAYCAAKAKQREAEHRAHRANVRRGKKKS